MECKKCGKEIPEDGKFCPYCGAGDVPAPGIKKLKRIAAVSGCVAFMAVLAAVLFLFTDILHLYSPWEVTAATCQAEGSRTRHCYFCDEVQTETLEKLVHEEGNEAYTPWEMQTAATCQKAGTMIRRCTLCGAEQTRQSAMLAHEYADTVCINCGQTGYLVSDRKAAELADTVVATVGDAELSNGLLQVYYQMAVLNFINQYSYYLSYFGLDYTQPLDQQTCPMEENSTWHQYFVGEAVDTWHQNQLLALEAQKNGFRLSEDQQTYLDELEATMTRTATESGFASLEELIHAQLGTNTTFADYRHYVETYYTSVSYFNEIYQQIPQLTEEELERYYQENREALEKSGVSKDNGYTVDVRHILLAVENRGTENKDGTITFPDQEDAAAAKAEAERVLALWLENPSETYFGELAKEYTADSNGDDGGLYENVTAGYMVTNFNDWCFDESRRVGDYGIVETQFGYHIMYFCGTQESWKSGTQSAYAEAEAQKMLATLLEAYPLKVENAKIALADVPLVSTESE